MQFPILSVLIFTPLAAALILLLLPEEKKNWIKGLALAAGIIVLALSVWLYASYDIAAGGYQFQERVDWLPALGISYFFRSKGLALAAGIIVLALSLWLYASYDIAAGGYQFHERVDWLPALGISYFVGVDGISLPLVFLSGLVIVSGVLVSWNVHDRPRQI